MDKGVKNTVIQIGVVYGAYVLLIKPMLPTFGASPEEEAAIHAIDMSNPVDNPFSFQYAPMVNFFNQQYKAGNTANMDMPTFIKYFKDQWDATDPKPPIDGTHGVIDAITGAEGIKSGLDTWYFLPDDTKVLGIFDVVQSKSQVASIAAVLWYLYGIDLWTYLKQGPALMLKALSPTSLKYVIDKVDSLPAEL